MVDTIKAQSLSWNCGTGSIHIEVVLLVLVVVLVVLLVPVVVLPGSLLLLASSRPLLLLALASWHLVVPQQHYLPPPHAPDLAVGAAGLGCHWAVLVLLLLGASSIAWLSLVDPLPQQKPLSPHLHCTNEEAGEHNQQPVA